MSEPVTLYGVLQICEALGVSRNWVHKHLKKSESPKPEFLVPGHGPTAMQLWSHNGVMRWLAYHASHVSGPSKNQSKLFSDHHAVNTFAGGIVTWKLWWKNTFDGGTQWWFSTPDGWYTSDDQGLHWEQTGLAKRPTDNRYFCVNTHAEITGSLTNVLYSCHQLRQRLEGEEKAS